MVRVLALLITAVVTAGCTAANQAATPSEGRVPGTEPPTVVRPSAPLTPTGPSVGLRGYAIRPQNPFRNCVNDGFSPADSRTLQAITREIRILYVCAPANPPGHPRKYLVVGPTQPDKNLLHALAGRDDPLPKCAYGSNPCEWNCPIMGSGFGYKVVAVDVSYQWWRVVIPSGVCGTPTGAASSALAAIPVEAG